MQAATSPEASPANPQGTLASIAPRRALAGFFISGILLAFLGAILPVWQHHLSSDYATVGFYFAGLIAGLLCSIWASPKLLGRKGTGWTLAFVYTGPTAILLGVGWLFAGAIVFLIVARIERWWPFAAIPK